MAAMYSNLWMRGSEANLGGFSAVIRVSSSAGSSSSRIRCESPSGHMMIGTPDFGFCVAIGSTDEACRGDHHAGTKIEFNNVCLVNAASHVDP